MSIFRRSMAEDAVDHYNHTWCFMLLLMLSLVTWLLPLCPVLQPQSAVLSESFPDINSQNIPKYVAQCWCPIHFTDSMVSYTQAICGAAFNQALDNLDEKKEDHVHGAILYKFPAGLPIPIGGIQEATRFRPHTVSTIGKAAAPSDITYFISVKTPLILFLFAICLKLPHIIWTVLSGCAGINFDQTLQTAKTGQVLDQSSRQKLNEDLVHAISGSAKSTSFSASFLYLFFKFLMCVVAIAALTVTSNNLLPEAKKIEKIVGSNVTITSHEDQESKKSMSVLDFEQDYTNVPLLCKMSVHMLSNIISYSIDCVFTPVDSSITNNMPLASGQQRLFQASKEVRMMNSGLYEALYTILMAFFVVLTIINVLSLLIWSAKLLLGSCRGRVSSEINLTMDSYLLLYMALENAGHLVTYDLAGSFCAGAEKIEEIQEEDT